jgi:hypothetical protein
MIGSRNATRATALLIALVLLNACGGGPPERSAGPASAPPTGVSAPPAGSPSPAATATGGAAPATSTAGAPAPTGSGGAVPTPSAPDDRSGDLVRGRQNLTGTVERRDGWVLLRSGETVWVLLGTTAAGLAAGSAVTVSGSIAAVPAGCPAAKALNVSRVTAR